MTDELLAGCDIQTDCAHDYLAGPWTLYRNVDEVNELFRLDGFWPRQLEEERVSGWVETTFSEIAKREVRVRVDDFHAYWDAELLRQDGDRLSYRGREISFFHFRYTKQWPLL